MFDKLIQSKTRFVNPNHIITGELITKDLFVFVIDSTDDITGTKCEPVDGMAILLKLINGEEILISPILDIILERPGNNVALIIYDIELFNSLRALLFN